MMPPAPPVRSWNVYSTVRALTWAPAAIKRLNDGGVVLDRRQHQRRLSAEFLRGIHVGAGLDEKLHGLEVSGPRRQHQRRFALAVGRVGGRPGPEQGVHDRRAADRGGLMERRHAIAARDARLRARARSAP